MRIIKLFFIGIFAMLLVTSCGGSTGTGDENDKNNHGSGDPTESTEITEGPGYPDDYRQWTDISQRSRWGPYNVHDPSCLNDGEWTYCFSTDVAYGGISRVGVQIRRSRDLVNWEFVGWAFSGIPDEAESYVTNANSGESPENIWAPYIMKVGDAYRLYYSVSVFGSNASYIGLATSSSLDGTWNHQGVVLTSSRSDQMNAIDPSVVVDRNSDEHWMFYGSWFSGIYRLQLDPETGMPLLNDDMGDLVARRSTDGLEAPEVFYHEPSGYYYLFVSYGDLRDIYNVRVSRSENPEGPFIDYFDNEMTEQTENYPLLTAPYQFNSHSGWQGVGHVTVFSEDNDYYMMHQGRLGLDANLMVMHLRKLTWTSSGWPVASPQRYGGIDQQEIATDSIKGQWEQITLESTNIPSFKSQPEIIEYLADGEIAEQSATWVLQDKKLTVNQNGEELTLQISHGYDWEKNKTTLIYTGLNSEGRSVWGKKVEEN